jgi:hypothetical protein
LLTEAKDEFIKKLTSTNEIK